MGVKNLWDILESCKQTLPLHHLQNKRLCVDLSCWIIQLQNATKGHNVRDKPYLRGLFHRLRALIALNCSLILVADGSIPALKLSTYKRRLGLCPEVSEDDLALHAFSLHRNMGSTFSNMIKEAKVLGLALGIPCLDGLEEAEAQCALLNSVNICDGCFSADSDAFLFGANTVYRDIFLGDGGYVVCYDMVDIERKLGFGRNSLITLALILGSDYSRGLQGFGREAACQIVKSIGDAHVLQKVVSEGFQFQKMAKGRRKASSFDCHTDKKPNDECMKKVGNGYIHDGYILPKIAERSLRRYANLRTSSLLCDIQVPLEEMPVPCPVFSITKRTAHKKACFEVSWQGVDGLESSVVSSDLLQSACPEKIREFREKETKTNKKQRPRLKKSEKATIHEVDIQLQSLLLSIESEGAIPAAVVSCNRHASVITAQPKIIDLLSPSPPVRACRTARLQKNADQTVVHTSVDLSCYDPDGQCETSGLITSSEHIVGHSTSGYSHSFGFHSPVTDERTVMEARVGQKDANGIIAVDLCSYDSDASVVCDGKMPVTTSIVAAKGCQESVHRRTDIIDISDSDTDWSPEHQRKAMELRLFINSNRDGLY